MPALENIQHEKFCQRLHKTGNQTQAAIDAGYSKKSARIQGSQLLTNINIKKRVKELQNESKLKYDIDMDELVSDLKSIKEVGRKTLDIYDREGNLSVTKPTDLAASLKAIDMLIKIVGEYAPIQTKNENLNYSIDDVLKTQEKEELEDI